MSGSFSRALRRRADRVREARREREERRQRIEQRELTYWNGEPTPCRRVRVLVAADEDHPGWVSNRWAGQERDAVEVSYNGETFYLDDEGYEQTDDDRERLEAHARALASMDHRSGWTLERARAHVGADREAVGYPGWGWAKVTHGKGSPAYGHVTLLIERVVAEREGG